MIMILRYCDLRRRCYGAARDCQTGPWIASADTTNVASPPGEACYRRLLAANDDAALSRPDRDQQDQSLRAGRCQACRAAAEELAQADAGLHPGQRQARPALADQYD